MLWSLIVVVGSLSVLFLGGWLFLNGSLYRDQEDKDTATQVAGTCPSSPIVRRLMRFVLSRRTRFIERALKKNGLCVCSGLILARIRTFGEPAAAHPLGDS